PLRLRRRVGLARGREPREVPHGPQAGRIGDQRDRPGGPRVREAARGAEVHGRRDGAAEPQGPQAGAEAGRELLVSVHAGQRRAAARAGVPLRRGPPPPAHRQDVPVRPDPRGAGVRGAGPRQRQGRHHARLTTPPAAPRLVVTGATTRWHGCQAAGSVSTKAPPPISSASAIPSTAIRNGCQSSRSEMPAKNKTAAKNTVERMYLSS